jgi:hypothetical protein
MHELPPTHLPSRQPAVYLLADYPTAVPHTHMSTDYDFSAALTRTFFHSQPDRAVLC